MNVIGDIFSGNPLNTTVGQRIDKATDGTAQSENWGLNMEICDIIIETEEGPKDAMRAIRKKLQMGTGKDWTSVMYTLTVLETCVKNCGTRFHLQIANRDFLNELTKIIIPKNEPTVLVQEKILSLIQSWADAFRAHPDLKAVDQCYQELKAKGISFPATDMDHMAPILTPKGNAPSSPTRPAATVTRPVVQSAGPQRPPHAMVPATANRNQQIGKLREDIAIVQGNCRVFNEMLNATHSGSIPPDTLDLMKELNKTCRQMQQRICGLLPQLADEQITEVLLRVNDDLNNAFLRYDRVERSQPPSTQPLSQAVSPSQVPSSTPDSESASGSALIDFGQPAPDSLSAQLNNMALNPTSLSNVTKISTNQAPTAAEQTGGDEFDMFIQSRKYDAAQHSVADSYQFQTENTDSSMSAAAAGGNRTGVPTPAEEPSSTSSEFDRFLAERAAAGENLPDQSANRNQRQLKKDESENALFAL